MLTVVKNSRSDFIRCSLWWGDLLHVDQHNQMKLMLSDVLETCEHPPKGAELVVVVG